MMAPMTISLPVDPDANELLSRNPLALLIGMLLDQQVPFEKAFSSPYELVKRLGHEPTPAELAEYDPAALAAVFAERPVLPPAKSCWPGSLSCPASAATRRRSSSRCWASSLASSRRDGGRQPATS